MDLRRKPTKKIVASGFVFLMLLALLATGASAADQIRDPDQLKDKIQDQLKDGSCILEAGISLCDQTRDRLKDGSCTVSSQASDCDGDQDRLCVQDRIKDGSCC
ncbi:MAG: hypothetical protein E4H06_02955 [Methanosarcina sp.]|nr:MAG: hypothetical protein E4H06_02955 [Methanosarcina sp.]